MSSQKYFEHYYQNLNEFLYSNSLLNFFETIVRSRLPGNSKVLDIGCGSYSLFEDVLNFKADITALDFSEIAISKSPQSNINYKYSNIVNENFFETSSFDLIFDSHCINCLTNEEERKAAFQNILKGLRSNGLLASEQMIQSSDESNVSMPFKKIKTAVEVEAEVLSYGFKIIYFTIVKDSVFVNEVDGLEITCDILRLIARKDF